MGAVATLHAPARLTGEHDVSHFSSREPDLDSWLKTRALAGEGRTARTYVVCADHHRVVGFYALANGAIQRATAIAKLRRNAPDPLPVMVIGRLAVDADWEKRGIAKAMLRDAILRTLQAAGIGGISAVLVHALSDDAKRFYQALGFSPSGIEPMTLMVTLGEAEAAIWSGAS